MTLSELNRAGSAATRANAGDLMERARRVAAVAAEFADDVDRAGRFPVEAIAAVKAEGLMGVMAPSSLGGEDASLSALSEICYVLGRACASTATLIGVAVLHQDCGEADKVEVHGFGGTCGGEADAERIALPGGFGACRGGGCAGRGRCRSPGADFFGEDGTTGADLRNYGVKLMAAGVESTVGGIVAKPDNL